MYPEPHFSAAEWRDARVEIQTDGFAADPLLQRLDRPCIGLNVAVCWPLPEAFRTAYEKMRVAIAALDPGVYVYPFTETHVTVATLVSFKRHLDPVLTDEAGVRELAAPAVTWLERLCPRHELELDLGAPVLVRAAGFIPVQNATGEIRALRDGLEEAVRGSRSELGSLHLPRGIHSTIVRFRRAPADPEGFCAAFDEIAAATTFGKARVHEILITTETRPYMLAGEIVHRTRLTARA